MSMVWRTSASVAMVERWPASFSKAAYCANTSAAPGAAAMACAMASNWANAAVRSGRSYGISLNFISVHSLSLCAPAGVFLFVLRAAPLPGRIALALQGHGPL